MQRLGVVFARLAQSYQPSTNPLSARPAHRSFRGLLGVHLRCGPHTRTVTCVTAIRGLQTFRRLHACPGCFRLERLAGWDSHPLESAAFSRRTRRATVGRTAGTGGIAGVQGRQGRLGARPRRTSRAGPTAARSRADWELSSHDGQGGDWLPSGSPASCASLSRRRICSLTTNVSSWRAPWKGGAFQWV